MALGQKKPDTTVGENTLLHGETLLVVASGDTENIALELISKSVGFNFLAHALLIERPHLRTKNLNSLL